MSETFRVRRCHCGHIHRIGGQRPGGKQLSATELSEPVRLVAFLTRRPDLDGISMLRVAAAVCEGA